jgi:hypothetical protein
VKVTPFRQPIRPGDVGSDVLAYKAALHRMGVKGSGAMSSSRTAGPVFVAELKVLQRQHKLKVDGIAGKATHALVAAHFSPYDAWLYRAARIRTHALYVSPFLHAHILVAGRIDQGVDYHGVGPICAIGDAEIIGNGGGGWPGRNYLLYVLLNGEHKSRHIYVAEAIEVTVRAGQKVKASDPICHFGADAAPGRFPGIETGWGSPTINLTRAAQMGNTGGHGHSRAPAGLAFARFTHQLGVPLAEDPGPGPVYV